MFDHDNEEALVNRDEPLPAIVAGSDGPSSDSESKRDRLRQSLSSSKLKGRLQDAGTSLTDSGHSLQDHLFSKLLQQVIPAQGTEDVDVDADRTSSKYLNRPGFSIPLMTTNFRRFNARIGVVFMFQNRLIRLLTWQKASHTLSFFSAYTFVCLNPYLFPVLPLAIILFFLFVPAFLARHPSPPSPTASMPNPQYSIGGPPLAPARTIKPASEMSKDFFRNMRDLQNMMDDFATVHDALLAAITPLTNFSNEPLSSALFVFVFVTACLLFPTSHLIPWRFIALVSGWSIITLGHPAVQNIAFTNLYKPRVEPASDRARSLLEEWIAADIILDSAPETCEVEIFELQRRTGSNPLGAVEWESWIFSPHAWEPTAPSRIAGERVKGTRFFEDVMPPDGWVWAGKKWELDLGSEEWVEERMVGGVEVELEGERWVYDIIQEGTAKGEAIEPERRRGEWRRRRWIRMVRRTIMAAAPPSIPRG
ncbi:hypothetical protein MMC30_008794 [Trapelia coarctata]|nr:hypothetical protein [Trapelia coarctata]